MHHWKCNGLKIQTEIKIPAWGKHYNQNKVVLTFFFIPVEAILEKSAWRQQVARLSGNVNFYLFIYFFSPADDDRLALESAVHFSHLY